MDYTKLNDYELISYAREADESSKTILIQKYKPLINKIATDMYKYCAKNGLEKNDLIQEGMIGLNSAIETYDESKEVIFYTYAQSCIQKRLISTLIRANRFKNKILNESISYDDDNNLLLKFIKDNNPNPEELLILSDEKNEIIEKIKSELTDYEAQVFDLLINGFKYKEIASILDRDEKSIDNAIQRLKSKIKGILDK